MSTTTVAPARPREPLNGVDVPNLFATLDVVKAQPSLGKFQFRATNRWQQGTHSRTRIQSFSGAGEERQHEREFTFDADHPAVLVGRDNAPTPAESLLHALAACLTAGIGNIASARGITLYEVESTVEGDIDLLGILGLSPEVRNGYEELRVNFKIRGDAPESRLRELVEQSRNRSAVFDTLTRGTRVKLSVNET
ncbi:MAG: OsmC family protein [Candidatus Eiseniibacteriota bacterium]